MIFKKLKSKWRANQHAIFLFVKTTSMVLYVVSQF